MVVFVMCSLFCLYEISAHDISWAHAETGLVETKAWLNVNLI